MKKQVGSICGLAVSRAIEGVWWKLSRGGTWYSLAFCVRLYRPVVTPRPSTVWAVGVIHSLEKATNSDDLAVTFLRIYPRGALYTLWSL